MTFDEFKRYAENFTVIPISRTLLADMHTPVSAYLSLRHGTKFSFLFESAEQNERIGRNSFIGIDPLMMVRALDHGCEVWSPAGRTMEEGDIFSVLAKRSAGFRQAPVEGLAGFSGGFVGYLGYQAVRHLEKIPCAPLPPDRESESMFALFGDVLRFDHLRQSMTMVHNVLVDPSISLLRQFESANQTLDALELRLRRPGMSAQHFSADEKIEESMTREEYCKAVRRAKEYIVEGDIFQVVLARRLAMHYEGDLFSVYRALRIINPSPYLFYLDFGETTLVGSSPEVLLRVQGETASVMPIAGTRKRGATETEDLALEQELLNDEKELSEHVMLVDLGRNDIGRIAEYGSVEVPVLKRIERYSHVMHIVSEVKGRLRTDRTSLDALKACFPAGTVSGAPKVRAMEIISELESVSRGAYAGAVGYLGFNGSLDTCIAIRTLVAHGGVLSVEVGAGIVADSVPEREYEETASKVRAPLEAVTLATRGLNVIPQSLLV